MDRRNLLQGKSNIGSLVSYQHFTKQNGLIDGIHIKHFQSPSETTFICPKANKKKTSLTFIGHNYQACVKNALNGKLATMKREGLMRKKDDDRHEKQLYLITGVICSHH